MTSATDICNLALGHIGQKADVESISPPEASIRAQNSAIFYPIARDALQELHAWSFNTRRATLAEVTNDLDSWAFAYALPSLCVKPLGVLLPGATDDSAYQPFASETTDDGEEVIYTNVEDAVLRFQVKVTDTSKFTPLYVTALSWLLASYLAGPILKGQAGSKVAREALQQFRVEFGAAASSNANASQEDHYRDYKPEWITDR